MTMTICTECGYMLDPVREQITSPHPLSPVVGTSITLFIDEDI